MNLRISTLLLALLGSLNVRGAEPRGGPAGVFRTDVPAGPFTLILGRPTQSSVAISVLPASDVEGFVSYGVAGGPFTNRTGVVRLQAGTPQTITLDGLLADTAYRYAFSHRTPSSTVFHTDTTNVFHTQRPPGAAYTFTVTADSHLDENTDPAIYAQTLQDAAGGRPDFHIDLGDTFMTGKRRNRSQDALPQYLAQRHYFGLLCQAAPLFLVLGNHDGETGRSLQAAAGMRTSLFPSPAPDNFYTGNSNGNYYAWHWGDASFVALDPFINSTRPSRGEQGGGWNFTLGRAQYDWFQTTLERSKARFKLVFIHHLVGGLDRQGRGGAEAVGFFEWGGSDPDGRTAFTEKRAGWPMPVHELMRRHGVTAVFHGHDHFYARQEVDGIIYQLVPQPGHPGEGSIGRAREYGYLAGENLPGAGYLRVAVSAAQVTVDFMRTGASGPAAAYTITAPRAGTAEQGLRHAE